MSLAEQNLPNLFVVGPPKAGTTSLYHHLSQHPEIFMSPVKEPMFFAEEMRLDHIAPELQESVKKYGENIRKHLADSSPDKTFTGLFSDPAHYYGLFAGAQQQPVIGEASTTYLWSKTAAARIAASHSAAKIIMILRNPADRAFSQYLMFAARYNCGPFQKFLDRAFTNEERDSISMLYPYLEFGLYAEQVQRYRDLFPAVQLGIWFYEDTKDPGFLRKVFEFLGVSGDFKADTTTRYLEQNIPRIPQLNPLFRNSGIQAQLRRMIPASAKPLLR